MEDSQVDCTLQKSFGRLGPRKNEKLRVKLRTWEPLRILDQLAARVLWYIDHVMRKFTTALVAKIKEPTNLFSKARRVQISQNKTTTTLGAIMGEFRAFARKKRAMIMPQVIIVGKVKSQ